MKWVPFGKDEFPNSALHSNDVRRIGQALQSCLWI
jgi:hypothetical protein